MLDNMKKTIKGLVMGSRKKYQTVGITFHELVEYILCKAAENDNNISQDEIDKLSSKYKLDNKTYESLIDILLENNVNIESDFLSFLEEEKEPEISMEEEVPTVFNEEEILGELQKVDGKNHSSRLKRVEKQDMNLMVQIDKYQFLSCLSQSLPNHESGSKELVDECKKQYSYEAVPDQKSVQALNCSNIQFYLPVTLTYLFKKDSLTELEDKYTEFFGEAKDFVLKNWNKKKNENTCLVIYTVAYFEALAYLYNIEPLYSKLLKDCFACESYEGFVDSLYRYYENTSMKYEWDTYYEFSMYDSIISTCKSTDLNVCIDVKTYELAIAKCTTYEEIYEEDQTETKETEDVQDVSSEDEFDELIEENDNLVEEVETNNYVEDSEENPTDSNGVLTLQDIIGEILNENSEETNKEDISNNDDGLVDEVLSKKEMVEENDSLVDENTDDDEKNESFEDDVLLEDSEETYQEEISDVDDELINEVLSEKAMIEESDISVNEVAEETEQHESAADDTLAAEVVSEEEKLESNEVLNDEYVATDTEDINEELVEENTTGSNDLSVDGENTEATLTTEIIEKSKESDNVGENADIVEYVQTNGYDNSWIDVTLESNILTFKNDFYVEFNVAYQTTVGTVLEDVDVYVITSNGTVVHPYEYIDGLGPIPKKIDVHFNNKTYNLKFSPLFSLLRESNYMNDDFTFNVSFKDVMRGYKVRISYILEDDKWKTKEVFAYQVR